MSDAQDTRQPEQPEPQVYAVSRDLGSWKFGRRGFLAAAAATAALAGRASVASQAPAAPAACGETPAGEEKQDLAPASYLPLVTIAPPGQLGPVPPGQSGSQLITPGEEVRWVTCGTPIPPDWTCTCDCVTVPPACSCDGHCSCVGNTGHYWYPN